MDIGRVGIWTFQLDLQPMARAQELAAELEELGCDGASGFHFSPAREARVIEGLLRAGHRY